MNYRTRARMHSDSRGFTLVETLVAITILMVAIVGPYYIIQQSINYAYGSRDSLIANSLAQEGMEFVYAIRDNNYLRNVQAPGSRTWLSSLDGTAGGTNGQANCFTGSCAVDPTQTAVAQCSVSGCSPLKFSDTNLYTQAGSGPETRFTRTVTMQQVTATQVKVSVRVSWSNNGRAYSTTVKEDLYNWL